MRPQTEFHISPADRVAVAIWSRRTIGVSVLLVMMLLALAPISRNSDRASLAASADPSALAPACLQWHEAASGAIARMAQSTRDVDLRQIGDAVFRMRRARRNCEAGWLTVACQDYRAVANGVAGRSAAFDDASPACTTVKDQPIRAVRRESWQTEH